MTAGNRVFDVEYTPALLYQVAKMDGAITLNANATKIVTGGMRIGLAASLVDRPPLADHDLGEAPPPPPDEDIGEAHTCLTAYAPKLHSEASEVIAFPSAMVEARHINVLAADAVVVLHFRSHQFRGEAMHMEANLFG